MSAVSSKSRWKSVRSTFFVSHTSQTPRMSNWLEISVRCRLRGERERVTPLGVDNKIYEPLLEAKEEEK